MSICDRLRNAGRQLTARPRKAGMLPPALLLALASTSCGAPSGSCLRYTDCAQGLTCAYGRCVVPPVQGADDAQAAGIADGAPASNPRDVTASLLDAGTPDDGPFAPDADASVE